VTACGDRHQVELHGERVLLACSINHGHTGAHQCYHADRLHQWPTQPTEL